MANPLTTLVASFRRTPPPTTFVASAEVIDITNENIVDSILKRREKWQDQAFKAYDTCGLIANGTEQVASLMSRISLFAAEQPTERDAEPTRTKDDTVIGAMDRLGSYVDVAALLSKLAQEQLLPGDCHLIGVMPDESRGIERETWFIVALGEIEKTTIADPNTGQLVPTIQILDYKDGKNLTLRPDLRDTWIRIWRQHPKRRNQATSPVRPLLGYVEELLWWEAAASAVAQNRLALSGLVGLPSNLESPVEAGEDPSLSGATRFAKRLLKAAIRTIQNPKSGSAAVPHFFTYPWNEHGKSGVDVIEFERKQDELLNERIKECKLSIAQGFPLPVEAFFGLSEATHWGGGQIEASKFSENVEPFVVFLVHALTVAWLRPILRAMGVEDADKYMVWYDASQLVIHPDMGQAADKGVEYGALSLAAWRRTRNFSESDAPSDAERAEMMKWLRGLRGREETSRPTGDPDDPNDIPTQPRSGEDRARVEQPAAPVRGKGQPILASSNGNGHTDLLASQLQIMCDEKIRRALEKAGNRLVGRAKKNKSYTAAIKGIPPVLVASTLGRDAVVALDIQTLFDDSFDEVPGRVVALAHPHFSIETDYSPATSHLTASMKEIAMASLFNPPTDAICMPMDYVTTALERLSPSPASS